MTTAVNPTANHASRVIDKHMQVNGIVTCSNIFTANEWKAYTPTVISGGTFATSATISARFRLVGSTLHGFFSYNDSAGTGAASSGAYVISMPSGVVLNARYQSMTIGSASGNEAATPINFTGAVLGSGTTSPGFTLLIGNEATSPVSWGNSAPAPTRLTTATGKIFSCSWSVEIEPSSPLLLVQNK